MTRTRRPPPRTRTCPRTRPSSRTLVERDLPHPGRMREIAEHNFQQALSLPKSAS
ncbi:hypothetical protein [Streptomyces sp. SID5643]|uniref:hypothetical protein n=1 Tax=Streptomyces sp. SID5643 TaxID=2690307 RepID=UPI001371B9A9|nr:hypothetical protein [Streptomyces sp. SID5643]MZF88653.1 hypothetical protein [Streptomyces sp. SID5643]